MTASSQVTAFALMKESASSNIIPQGLDEYKPSKLDKQHNLWLLNHFRDVYDGHEGLRGKSDQSMVIYDLMAPLMVVGEESPDEAAVRERTIELSFSKKDIKQKEVLPHFQWVLGNRKLLSMLGRSLLDCALDTTVEEVGKWYDEGEDFFAPELPQRVQENLRCLYAGLCLIAKLCGRLGLSWDLVFPCDRDACIKYINYAAREYLLDGSFVNKSILDQTFEVFARMKLKLGEDYAFENNGQILCLSKIYDRYTKYRKDFAVSGEILTQTQFVKQLSHSEYLIDLDKSKRFTDKSKKCWVIDFAKLSARCDVSGFLRDETEPPLPPDDSQLPL